jgi:hypothetical protein
MYPDHWFNHTINILYQCDLLPGFDQHPVNQGYPYMRRVCITLLRVKIMQVVPGAFMLIIEERLSRIQFQTLKEKRKKIVSVIPSAPGVNYK